MRRGTRSMRPCLQPSATPLLSGGRIKRQLRTQQLLKQLPVRLSSAELMRSGLLLNEQVGRLS